MTEEPTTNGEELFDPSNIDGPDAMREFMGEIRDRAKQLSSHCIENRKPHVAAKALWMLAQGAPVAEAARVTGLSHESVRKLQWRHNDTLETKRKDFSVRYAMVASEYTDLLFQKSEMLANDPEQLKMISPDKLALTIGIMTDKASQLMGMATTVVEHRKGTSIEDAAKLIQEAKTRVANKMREVAIEAEVVQ